MSLHISFKAKLLNDRHRVPKLNKVNLTSVNVVVGIWGSCLICLLSSWLRLLAIRGANLLRAGQHDDRLVDSFFEISKADHALLHLVKAAICLRLPVDLLDWLKVLEYLLVSNALSVDLCHPPHVLFYLIPMVRTAVRVLVLVVAGQDTDYDATDGKFDDEEPEGDRPE